MSSRPRIKKFKVITDGDMSLTSLTSTVTIIEDLTMVGYAFSWVGTAPVGVIAVQVSNDYALASDGQTASNAGTWTTLTINYGGSAVTSVPVSGTPGTGFIDIGSIGAYAIRTVYTKTSGVGTLQAIIQAKVA